MYFVKIVQINIVYKEGSTGKIVYDLHRQYQKRKIDSYVIYGQGNHHNDETLFKTSNGILRFFNTIFTYSSGYMYKGSMFATWRTINKIKKIKPDVVHVHCINGHMANIYYLFNFLKKKNIKTIITQHAEFLYTGSYTHVPKRSTQWLTGEKERLLNAKKLSNSWFFNKTHESIQKFKKTFNNYNKLLVISVSPWLTERSKKSFVFKNKPHDTVLNGIDTNDVFRPCISEELINKYKKNNEKIILHVTSGFTHRLKGSEYLLKVAKKLEGQNLKFLLIGLNDKNIKLPKNCINVGIIKDQKELVKFYSMADVTAITSKKETFSMIVAESLSCGTPVVGFKAGGPESISLSKYSDFVEFGDIDQIINKIKKWIDVENLNRQEISSQAREKYSHERMALQYIEHYHSLMNMS
jgi:putative colanic acid biosynthesis glycosyltransferase